MLKDDPIPRQSVKLSGAEHLYRIRVPNHVEIRIGTLQSIIRQSGIDRSEFELPPATAVDYNKPVVSESTNPTNETN
jgi:hypothetical protein